MSLARKIGFSLGYALNGNRRWPSGGSGAPVGPDGLFVSGAVGDWWVYTPPSKLNQDSAGSGDPVEDPGDIVAYWEGWNSGSYPLFYATTGNCPEYAATGVLFDATSTQRIFPSDSLGTISSPASGKFFCHGVRIIPRSDGNIYIGEHFGNVANQLRNGIRLAPSGVIKGYTSGNDTTASQTWTVDQVITILVTGDGNFGSTNLYVGDRSGVTGMFTSSASSDMFGIYCGSGSFELQSLLMLRNRGTALSNADIDEAFDFLNTEP